MAIMKQKITICLWFDKEAEEAAKFYTSVFRNSKILGTSRYSKSGAKVSGQKEGSVMTVQFELDGQKFLGLNGGPIFKFNEAISLIVNCKDQKEIDYFWAKLAHEEVQCGWLRDKYGVSWQIVPETMGKIIQGSDKAMQAMLKMKKIDVKTLEQAKSK